MARTYEVIFCIINAGFSDAAMSAARGVGATGGTILKGRGTASRRAEELFNISIQPEKEILMLLVPKEIKDDVLRALYYSVGLNTAGQGIAFSMPVEHAIGLKDFAEQETDQIPEA